MLAPIDHDHHEHCDERGSIQNIQPNIGNKSIIIVNNMYNNNCIYNDKNYRNSSSSK